MTTFMVNGQEKRLRYNVNGIDISGDFIGNTSHGMETDDEGRYIASQEDYDWWRNTIDAHQNMDEVIEAYKEKFDPDEIDKVVNDWTGVELGDQPKQVIIGLEEAFGSLRARSAAAAGGIVTGRNGNLK